jgi:streptogramin lyase
MIVTGVVWLCMATGAAADPAPELFNLPTGYNAGTGIAPASDGTVWFAANPTTPNPALGRLDTAQAAAGTANGMTTYPTPLLSSSCCANQMRSVAYDPKYNRVWFVQNDGIVGSGNPPLMQPGASNGIQATLLSTVTTSGPYSPSLLDIAVAPDGLAWFTENSSYNVSPYPGGRIASVGSGLGVTESDNIALQNGQTSLNSLRYDSKPAGITTAPDGTPWFVESDPGNPGYRIARASGRGYVEYPIQPCVGTPCSGSYTGTGPTDVAVALDGSIWFTNQLRNEVGRLDTNAGTFTNYSLPAIDPGLANGQARAISVAQDGTLWVAEYGGISDANANAIVRIVPTQPTPTATVFHLGSAGYPFAVAPDTRGNVWFSLATLTAPGKIGRLAGVVGAAPASPPPPGTSTAPPGATTVTPASVGRARIGNPKGDGGSVTVDQICVGPPHDRCSLVYIISAHEYVTGFPGTHSRAASVDRAKKKARPVILGQRSVTLRGGQHRKVTITLNAKGRKLLKSKGRLQVYFTATQAQANGKPKRVKQTKMTLKRPKRH